MNKKIVIPEFGDREISTKLLYTACGVVVTVGMVIIKLVGWGIYTIVTFALHQ